jgi:hypothetical protein
MKGIVKQKPYMMDVIINIQTMKSKINSAYDPYSDFKNLNQLTEEQLYRLQDRLILEYNKTVKNQKSWKSVI